VIKCRFLGVTLGLQVHSVAIARNPGDVVVVVDLGHPTNPEVSFVDRLLLNEDKLVKVKGNLLATDHL
jgi:hypothetical protein